MEIRQIKENEILTFKKDMQDAFQKGYEDYFGKSDELILPFNDIDESLNTKGANTFVCVEDNKILGGAIVVINDNNINELHFLYANVNYQSKGVGFKLWNYIENSFPSTIKWTTCTPYFDKRNIHFYVNKCKFHIVEYIIEKVDDDFIGDHNQGMFEFEKIMAK